MCVIIIIEGGISIMKNYLRDTYAVVNLDNLTYNIQTLKSLFLKDDLFYAVIKANGYGHGATHIAKTCIEAGANRFAVATLDEAVQLRKDGIIQSILVLGPTRIEDLGLASKLNIDVTCPNAQWAQSASTHLSVPLSVHLKVNTGMNRIGVDSLEQVNQVIEAFKDHSHISLEGIYTHFATADEDEDYLMEQINMFKFVVEKTDYTFKVVHAANTAATMKYLDRLSFCNACRVGIGLYGYSPFGKDDNLPRLKPVIELYSHVTNTKHVHDHEKVGYGATYDTHDEYISTLSYGYADGICRRQHICSVQVEDQMYPIVGRICMDQMMFASDLDLPVGTKVGLITTSNSADTIANQIGTIPHEILCAISKRVPRIYRQNGKTVNIVNDLAF